MLCRFWAKPWLLPVLSDKKGGTMAAKLWFWVKKLVWFAIAATISFWIIIFALVIIGMVSGTNPVGDFSVLVTLTTPIVVGVFAVKRKYPKVPTKTNTKLSDEEQPDTEHQTTCVDIERQANTPTKEEATPRVVAEKSPAEKVYPTEKTYRVAGTSFRLENIAKLGTENPDYYKSKKELIELEQIDEKIWKYEFYSLKATVTPEPDNPVDPNAIMVEVNGQHVGYIKAGSCAHLLKVIKGDRIRGIDCDIRGGPYKVITEDYDEGTDKEFYRLEKGELNYSVVLHIFEAPAT